MAHPAPRSSSSAPLASHQESAVRSELERILHSPVFCSSPRMQRFLQLVVNETLAGRALRLKEYTIGVEAFDRPETYSPMTDPIVRVEARRLRDKLRRYYQGQRDADVVIDLPKGRYLPVFSFPEPPIEAEPTSLTVRPFIAVSAKAQAVCDALLFELVDQFVRVRGIQVKTGGSEVTSAGLMLAGCVHTQANGLRVVAQLITAPQLDCRWSTAITRTGTRGIVQAVAALIAGRAGAYLSRGASGIQ